METNSKIALFADDSYLYRRISSIEDSKQLQTDLDNLVTWEKKWSMKFHPAKCKLLRVTKKRKVIDAHYQIHGQQLETGKSQISWSDANLGMLTLPTYVPRPATPDSSCKGIWLKVTLRLGWSVTRYLSGQFLNMHPQFGTQLGMKHSLLRLKCSNGSAWDGPSTPGDKSSAQQLWECLPNWKL